MTQLSSAFTFLSWEAKKKRENPFFPAVTPAFWTKEMNKGETENEAILLENGF